MHGLAEGSNNYTLEWTTDATFAGPIEYDSDGDFLSDAQSCTNGSTARSFRSPERLHRGVARWTRGRTRRRATISRLVRLEPKSARCCRPSRADVRCISAQACPRLATSRVGSRHRAPASREDPCGDPGPPVMHRLATEQPKTRRVDQKRVTSPFFSVAGSSTTKTGPLTQDEL